ncbi:MAG: hypothetical protein WC443_13480 [Desulfobaccales bacterium]
MLSLTKKSDAQPVAAPLWHTNFRNFDRLPDTKVVRTTFFINTAAGVVALGMLLWLGQREYTNYNLKEQKAEAQRQIDSNNKQNAEALRLIAQFQVEEKKLNEAAAFIKVPVTPAEFISLLAETLPKDISIDFVETRLNTDPKTQAIDPKSSIFLLRGRVAGSPDQASGIASSYVDMLRADPKLGKIFDPIELKRLDRSTGGAYMLFDISLNIKAGK